MSPRNGTTPTSAPPREAVPLGVEVILGPLPSALADRLVAALGPESGGGVPRTQVEIERSEATMVVLRITAPSTPAARAALNAHLRWIALALRVDQLSKRSTAVP